MTATTTPWVTHFGFSRTPFTKRIAARDLYLRDAHAEAVARICFCVADAALGVICGEVGAGKTVAVRAAVATLDQTRHHLIYVPNPAFGTRGLYVAIVSALGANPRFHKAEVMRQATDLLAAEEAERHRRVVLVIDEAHLLSPEQLEELRLLTNADLDSTSPFAGILVGQPTLARKLRLGVFAALDQRIATRYTLAPWTWPTPPPTCATTSPWSVAPTPCSPTTPSPGSTASPAACPASSTTPPPPPSSPLQPTARPWSTTPAPNAQPPNSPATDHHSTTGHPPAPTGIHPVGAAASPAPHAHQPLPNDAHAFMPNDLHTALPTTTDQRGRGGR